MIVDPFILLKLYTYNELNINKNLLSGLNGVDSIATNPMLYKLSQMSLVILYS